MSAAATAAATIREAVAAAVVGSHGVIRAWSEPEERPWSWQFRADTPRAPLLVKIPRWEGVDSLEAAFAAGPQADTAGEFGALEELARLVAASGDPGLAAVVPVAHVVAVNAIVMEVFAGSSLRRRLGFGAPPAATVWLGRVGSLLGHYHRSGVGVAAVFPVEVEVERWREIGLRHPRLAPAASLGGAAARRLAGHRCTETIQHGDLTLGNVLVSSDDRVALIDPNRTPGRAETDVATLVGELRLGRSQLLSFGLGRGRRVLDTWEGVIAAGHGGLDPAVLAYECGAEALSRRITLATGRWPGRRIGAVAARRFDAEIRRRFSAV
ncbi:MAG: phosphotransferase [Acidimicrobiia bacterium]|nr:phosphotransferase [Acidimicrobiia bacterium]